MRAILFTIVAIGGLSLGCSGNSETPNGDPGPFECSLDTRDGLFLVSYETVSGDCGDLGSQVVRLDPDNPTEGCTLDAPSEVSADQCTIESSVTCIDDEVEVSLVGSVTQRDAAGDVFTGIATFYATFRDGTRCAGTYRLRYVRQ